MVGWEGLPFVAKCHKEGLKESLLQQKCLQILLWLIRPSLERRRNVKHIEELQIFVIPTRSLFICEGLCNFQLHFSYMRRFMYIDACTHAHCIDEIYSRSMVSLYES